MDRHDINLYYLRVQQRSGGAGYRIFCYWVQQYRLFVLLNGFFKTTRKIPDHEGQLASELCEEYDTSRRNDLCGMC